LKTEAKKALAKVAADKEAIGFVRLQLGSWTVGLGGWL